MKKYILRGLPEALAGVSEIKAATIEAVLLQFPVLIDYRNELKKNAVAEDYKPCDG